MPTAPRRRTWHVSLSGTTKNPNYNPPKEQQMTPAKNDQPDAGDSSLPDAVLAGDDRIPIDWNTDPLAVQRKIVDKIFKASSVDEVFEVYAGDATASLENKVFNIL